MVTTDAARAPELKVVFTGPMGAGKTTAIRGISQGQTLSTEVPISQGAQGDKRSTTVGLDYGECALGEGLVLKLFGTPGQERFRFMWDILARGAFGVVVLTDNSQGDPLAQTLHYLQAFAPHLPARRMVVGVGRLDSPGSPGLDEHCAHLARHGFAQVPVIDADARRAEDMRVLLSVLVSMVEMEHA